MSQFDFGDLESPLSGTALINSNLEPWRDTLHSQHSGNSVPPYVVAGMIWWNTTTNPWVLNAFDGSDNIELGKLDTSLNTFTPANIPTQWAGAAGGSANALTFTPTPVFTSYTTGRAWEGQITTTNTAAGPTVNVSGLGALTVKTFLGVGKVNVPIGCLQAGMIARFVYDGTDAILLNPRNYNAAASVATAATVNLDTTNGDYVRLTGTTTVTAITLAEGVEKTCVAVSGFQITHGSSLLVQGGANYAMAAGDVFVVRGESSGVVRVYAIYPISGTAVVAPNDNDFRLTLTTGVPVTTSNVTGATTIYCTPYKGNNISLYNGSKWITRKSAQFSLALGTLTSGRPYDVFCYDNAGVPTLEFLAWTNDTTRATNLTYQDGVLVKNGDATRRYLGTFYTTSTTQTEDSTSNRYLYNYYNRVLRPLSRVESTSSWTYTTATWRQANASSSNQVSAVIGVSEDAVNAYVHCAAFNSGSSVAAVGVGIDSTTTNAAQVFGGFANSNGTIMTARYTGMPAAGRHYFAWLEVSTATGTTTWNGSGTLLKSGIEVEILA